MIKEENPSINEDEIRRYINICNVAIEGIDQDSVLLALAIKNDPRMEAAKIKNAMEKHRTILVECLCRMGIYHCKLYLLADAARKKFELDEVFSCWKGLLKYVDPNDKVI